MIAQGVVTFTEEPIDWRVYEFEADPEAPREAVEAAAGFTFVDEGGLIVGDANTGHEALLREREAAFSNDGDQLLINTEGADPAEYRRIVLLPDEFEDATGTDPAFESDGFTIAAGKRRVELSIGVLADETVSYRVAASAEGTGLIMLLSGEATVTGNEEPVALEAGDYLSLTERVDITTASEATFAAVRIGTTVRDVTQPIPAGTEPEESPPDDTSGSGDGTGTLTLQLQICGMGGQAGGCANRPDAAVLEVSGPGLADGPVLTYEIAANDDGVFVLPDLPYGEYVVTNVDHETGIFETEGGVPDPGQPNVVTVTVSADNPEPVLTIRQLPPPGDGVIAVELYVCPDGLPAPWAEPWFCAVHVTGWDLSLTSDAFSGSLTTADAPASDAGYTFSGLPVGYEYRLSLQEMPDGHPLIQVKPASPGEGPVRVDLQPDYSVQTVRFYAVTTAETDLSGPDTDGDGLPDHLESGVLGTDPAIVDSDGDGVTDRDEVQNGTNPLDPASYSVG